MNKRHDILTNGIKDVHIEWLSKTVKNLRIKVDSIEQVIQVNSAYKNKKKTHVEKLQNDKGYIIEVFI